MTVRYPSLENYLHTAAFVLDLPVETVVKAVRLDLAESALHAPQAAWGGVEFHPTFPKKAAVLLVRLTKNHVLPDGNKRTALAVPIAFCNVNGFDWLPPARDKRSTSSYWPSPPRPARTRSWSKPRSRPGSPSGCTSASRARGAAATHVGSRLGDTSEYLPA